jgi:hypothetical protein
MRCDSCVQCRHGRPEGGWPNEEHTWVAECREYSEAVIVPFAGYKDFKECVSKNQDKADPKGYCASIMRKVEGKDMDKEHFREPAITRMFNAVLGPVDEKIVATGDGGLIIKDIIVLAEGTWTDSLVRTPLHYTAKTLSKDATNWAATGIWSRHSGGAPRSINDKIGDVRSPRFSLEHKAVLADGFLHGRTQASRDVIELVKAGLVTDVSAEVGGKEVWNAEAKRYEAASLAFYGLAIVDRGACDVCKLKHNEAGGPADDCQTDKTKEGESMGDETKQPSEAEKKLADLESEKAGFVAELAALKEKIQADEKARTDRIGELEKLLSEKDARVKELEKSPAPPKTLTGDTPDKSDERELAAPPMRVIFRSGQVERA